MIYQWEMKEEQAGERIDKLIVTFDPAWTRAQIQEWIRQGRVQVEGKSVKPNYRVKQGETLQITPPEVVESAIEPEAIPLEICYEDQDLLVINKPRGLVVHPAPGHRSGTLVNALLHHCRGELSGIGGVSRPGIVHRIDKDTSGLLVVAKNDMTHQSLSSQLQAHEIERIYTAFVDGLITHPSGTINAPIGRDSVHRKRMQVDVTKGKSAVTHFQVNKRFTKHTWIDCQLETGRTHQIRVHMKYIGFPIVGDPLYGHKQSQQWMEGQALHAKALHFIHPRTGKRIEIEAEMPQDMQELLQKLSNPI